MSDSAVPGSRAEISADRQRIMRLEARVSELEALTRCLRVLKGGRA